MSHSACSLLCCVQGIEVAPNQEWDTVITFAGSSAVAVAEISAIVLQLASTDTSSEAKIGRAPPLALATEVKSCVQHATKLI